jgi:hypothetical protein
MLQDFIIAFATVWIGGLIVGVPIWKVTAAGRGSAVPAWRVRSFYVALVLAPSVMHLHGDYYLPAVFYVFYAFTGDIAGALLYGGIPVLLTWAFTHTAFVIWFGRSNPPATNPENSNCDPTVDR